MSYRTAYYKARKNRSRYSQARPCSRKLDLFVFMPLLLVMFVALTFFSPFFKSYAPAEMGRAVFKVIPELQKFDLSLLLTHSIPGLRTGLDVDGAESLQSNNNNLKETQTSPGTFSKFLLNTELTGFNRVEPPGVSFTVNQTDVYSGEYPDGYVGGETGDVEDFFMAALPERLQETIYPGAANQPLILIYHTHATESFLPLSGEAFSTNLEKTVVVLGDYLAQILQEDYGIPVLHYREVFDIPRRTSYEKARPSMEKVLQENPGIEVVIDLHRDGVSRNVTTATINGKNAGRVLFVIGSNHPDWYSNLRFALFMQDALEEVCPGLSRGIRKQPFTYNQHLHRRSLIVEIGGHENSLEEVQRTIPYLARALAATLQ